VVLVREQRKDIMHFFKHAVKRSFSEGSRHGFRALASTCQLTVDSMQAIHVKAPVRRSNAKETLSASSRVPRPRFWGNPQVDHYDLQRLRSAIVEIGSDPSKSPEFPGAGKEVADANSNAAFAKFRRDTETFWKLATELSGEVQQIPIEASQDEAIRAFEQMVSGKVAQSESCIIYSIQCEFAAKLQEISFWCPRKKETLILPRGSGLPSAVLEAKCSIAVADLHNHKMYSRELESDLGYPRQSALLSPCFNELGQMAFILEVASAAKIVRYTIHDKMLLEFAGALLMLLISRTRLAEEYREAIAIRNHVVKSVTVLADADFIRTINQIADRCRECVKGKISRVWLADWKNQILFVNTDDETKAEMASMTHASGPLGAAFHDQTSSVSFMPAYSDEDPVSFACVPIVDRSSTTLGVLELNQKYNPTTGLIERFREEDCDMMRAFAAILANFIEHSQFVFNVRSTCDGMDQKIRAWQASADNE
jgi:GAF domain-containing protein